MRTPFEYVWSIIIIITTSIWNHWIFFRNMNDKHKHEIGNSFFQSNITNRVEPRQCEINICSVLLSFYSFVLNLFHTIQFNEETFFFVNTGTHKNQRSYSISTLSSIVFILCRSATDSKTLAYALLFIWFFFVFYFLSVFSLNIFFSFFSLFINILRQHT